MNKALLMGRLTRNPVIGNSDQGISMASFTLAVSRKIKDNGEEETDFLKCITFDKQADFTKKYLRQGSKIFISGRIQNNSYLRNNGQLASEIQIIVEEVEFAESKVR